ncbi:TPA: hypothetical protein ACK1SE_003553 [Proteus mirabilis]
MKINIPDDYLKYRYFYISYFVNYKNYFISGLLNNSERYCIELAKIIGESEYNKGKVHYDIDSNIRRDMPGIVNSKKFFPINGYNFIIDNNIRFVRNRRALNVLMIYLINAYVNFSKSQNISVNLLIDKSIIPINVKCDKDNNISLDSVILFLDFLCVILYHSNVDLNDSNSFLNQIINYFDGNKDPFGKYNSEVFIDWIYARMEKNNMLNEYDINKLLRNGKEKIVKSSFDFWALSKSKAEIKLYLIEMRKSWSQKKFRDGVKDKKVLNTYISKKAGDKLKKISKEENKNMSDILDFLILNSDEIIKKHDFWG